MNSSRIDNHNGLRVHAGHWLVALLLSGLFIGLSLAAFVPFSPVPAPPNPAVVMSIQLPGRAAPAESAVQANRTDIRDATQVPPVDKPARADSIVRAVQPKPTVAKPKTARKAKPKPSQKPKLKPKPASKQKQNAKPLVASVPEPKPRLLAAARKPRPEPDPNQIGRATGSSQAVARSKPAAPPIPPELSDADRNAYAARIAEQLSRAKRYPQRARRWSMEGVASVRFAIDRHGNVLSKTIEATSGSPILDQAALSVIDRAEPFEAPPVGFGASPHVFRIPIAFELR